jgi:pilus assembly protein Flp/PilA
MCSLTKFLWGDEGATAVEYAVMLALVLMAAIAGIMTVGQGNGGLWSNNGQQISTAFGS